MKLTIEQSNKLIAEFMGLNCPPKNGIGYYSVDELDYNSSWDWLMPVVEKIESLRYWVEIRGTYIGIGIRGHEETIINRSFSSIRTKNIEALYRVIVEFINWYNTQPTTNK